MQQSQTKMNEQSQFDDPLLLAAIISECTSRVWIAWDALVVND